MRKRVSRVLGSRGGGESSSKEPAGPMGLYFRKRLFPDLKERKKGNVGRFKRPERGSQRTTALILLRKIGT